MLPTLPSSAKHVITLVDLVGEPMEPIGVMAIQDGHRGVSEGQHTHQVHVLA